MRTFLEEVLEFAERSGEFKLHFASAREAFNMVMAAADGRTGELNAFRDYKLRQIMKPELPADWGRVCQQIPAVGEVVI